MSQFLLFYLFLLLVLLSSLLDLISMIPQDRGLNFTQSRYVYFIRGNTGQVFGIYTNFIRVKGRDSSLRDSVRDELESLLQQGIGVDTFYCE